MPRGRIAGLVAIIAIAACARVAATWRVFSQTVDEPIHVAAGHQWLREGRYDLDVEHPPLARILFALDAWDTPAEGSHVARGNQLFWRDGRYLTNLARARAGNLPFLVLAVLVVYFWSAATPVAALAGKAKTGLIAAALFACLPPVLAHAGLTTTDMAVTATTIAALYALARFLDDPSWSRAALLALAIAAGVLSKFSFLLFFAVGALVLVVFQLRRVRWARLMLVVPVVLFLILAGYRFRSGSMEKAREGKLVTGSAADRAARYAKVPGYEWVRADLIERFHRDAARAEGAGVRNIDFVDWAKAAGYPSPLAGRSGRDTMAGAPELEPPVLTEPLRAAWRRYVVRSNVPAFEFLLGVQYVRMHSAMGHGEAWLFDRNRSDGFWYYFPVVLFFKTPLPFLILAIIGLGILARRAPALALIPLAILGAAMTTRINIGVRHVLPVYPFLAIAAAVAVVTLWRHTRAGRAFAAVLLLWFVIGTTLAHPDYLPWFNEAAGRHPERVAADSNLDWGQDLLRLADVMQNQPLHIGYFGSADVSRHLPQARALDPARCTTGRVAVSEMIYLRHRDRELRWLTRFDPVRRVGASIRLYDVPERACD